MSTPTYAQTLLIDDVFSDLEVKQEYVSHIKLIIERENLSFQWRFFVEYEGEREGIRYQFEEGYIDWLIPNQLDNQHLYVSNEQMQYRVIQWLNARFMG
jgi:hypothetical protein